MNGKLQRWKVGAAGLLLLAAMYGCVVTGGGYDGYDEGYVGGFYETPGFFGDGWGSGYHVGPSRGGERRGDGRHAPSIPSRGRGGGGFHR
jgi:hypothetical protein